MSRADRFLKACRCEPVDTTPVWFMRQAGRYMPEYRALRRRHPILEMIHTPELAAEVTLQPVRAFPVDAAIIFADILPLLTASGFELDFISGEGPVIHNPLRDPAAAASLPAPDPLPAVSGTLDAIARVRRELDGEVPLIGFSGAPFTLACYAIEGRGNRRFSTALDFLRSHPRAWHELMDHLSALVAAYLRAQADAGAQALQLFDSWAGLLAPDEYREHVLPYSRRILSEAADTGCPRIHFTTGTADMLEIVDSAGADVLGIDWRIDLAAARPRIRHANAIQGNLDPDVLATAPPETLRHEIETVLQAAGGRPGHIFNLGHGVLKHTPPENVARAIDIVHNWTPAPPVA